MASASRYTVGWGTTRPSAALSRPGPSRIRPGMGLARNAEESGRVVGPTRDLGEGLRQIRGSSPFLECPSSSVIDTGRKRIIGLACNAPPRALHQPGGYFGPARGTNTRTRPTLSSRTTRPALQSNLEWGDADGGGPDPVAGRRLPHDVLRDRPPALGVRGG